MAISACGVPGVQMSIRSMSSRSMSARQSVSTDGEAEPLRGRAHRVRVPAGHRGELRRHRQVEEPVARCARPGRARRP